MATTSVQTDEQDDNDEDELVVRHVIVRQKNQINLLLVRHSGVSF